MSSKIPLTEALRAKDREQAALLEEKMALHMKMVGHTSTSMLEVPKLGKRLLLIYTGQGLPNFITKIQYISTYNI